MSLLSANRRRVKRAHSTRWRAGASEVRCSSACGVKAERPINSIVLVMAIAVFLAVAASPAKSEAEETYSLGVALGLTGTGKPYSEEALEGIELAVSEINAAGGFLGRHLIELHVRNTRTRPEIAEMVVKELIENQNARAVIGTYSSASALAIKPICRAHKVLHIATVSNSEDITKLDFSPYTFSVVPNTYMMAKAVALGVAKLAREAGWKNYVTIASDYAWGRSSQTLQIQLLQELAPDLRLLGSYWPPLGESSFNTFVVAIMNQRPDFVLESIAGTDNAYWMRTAWDYRLLDRVDTPGSLISVSELQRGDRWVRRGIYGRTRAPFFAHLDVPKMKDFVENYREKFGRYPTDWAVMSYDGVYALKQGIEKAGTIDSEQVKDAMRGMSIETTRGQLFFREIDNQLSASAYFGRIDDDSRYPFRIYSDLVELKGPDIWRPESEIVEARRQANP